MLAVVTSTPAPIHSVASDIDAGAANVRSVVHVNPLLDVRAVIDVASSSMRSHCWTLLKYATLVACAPSSNVSCPPPIVSPGRLYRQSFQAACMAL